MAGEEVSRMCAERAYYVTKRVAKFLEVAVETQDLGAIEEFFNEVSHLLNKMEMRK